MRHRSQRRENRRYATKIVAREIARCNAGRMRIHAGTHVRHEKHEGFQQAEIFGTVGAVSGRTLVATTGAIWSTRKSIKNESNVGKAVFFVRRMV